MLVLSSQQKCLCCASAQLGALALGQHREAEEEEEEDGSVGRGPGKSSQVIPAALQWGTAEGL